MTLAQDAKKILRDLGTSPRKKFGQNFMTDPSALAAIAEALAPQKNETVLEIGPGLGFLTSFLLGKGARVFAVEKDGRFAAFLRDRFGGKNCEVIEKDVLKVDLKKDLPIEEAVKIAGNIPYNITSPILEWMIARRQWVSRACLTVQREVAERLTARPGNKAWGALSIFLQFYSEVELVRKIGRANFYPAPKVDSALVKITFLKEPRFQMESEEDFFSVVRRSFQKRRKTLLNSLEDRDSKIFSKDRLAGTLAAAGIDANRRPETLSISEWVKLVDMIY